MSKLRPLWIILLWVVALMSGILSLVREALGIYAPHLVGSGLFWACTRIAFILSIAMLVFKQRREIASLQSAKRKPVFRCQIDLMTGLCQRVRTATNDPGEILGTMITANGLISNSGEAASGLFDWTFSVEISGKVIPGRLPMTSGKDVTAQLNFGAILTLPAKNHWPTKTLAPLECGGSMDGWISGLFAVDLESLYDSHAVAIISFRDVVVGERHEFRKEFSRKDLAQGPTDLFTL